VEESRIGYDAGVVLPDLSMKEFPSALVETLVELDKLEVVDHSESIVVEG